LTERHPLSGIDCLIGVLREGRSLLKEFRKSEGELETIYYLIER